MANKPTPILWYKFEKNSENQITEEANSYTYDATLYNNAQVKDMDTPIGKKALSLYNRPVNSSVNNTGQYMSIPPFQLGGKLTVTFWFKKDTKDEASARIFDFYNQQQGITDKQFTAYFDNSGHVKISKNDKNGKDTMTANITNLCNGKWNHIAIAHDGKYVTVYINNISPKPYLFSEIETLTRSHNNIGRGSDQKIHYSTISIDDFRIYDTDLDKNDINEIYNYKKENHDDNHDKKDKEQDNKKITNDKKTKTANTSSTNSSFNDTFMKYYHKNKIATIAVVSIIGVIVVVLLILFIVKVIVPFVNRLRGKTSEDSSS